MTDSNDSTADDGQAEERAKNAEELLQEEIKLYQREHTNVDNMLGKLGGVQSHKKERILNVIILCIAIAAFALNIMFKLVDPIYTVEFGILLISIKIIMLIHSLSKMSHFNFWILHSIDLRINDIARKQDLLEHRLQTKSAKPAGEGKETEAPGSKSDKD
ncbi:hypothetical protein P0082_09225 [Candidatus Haliotispira prima]|uniref:Uncharacterized protein n=1 Tax=Candidatus Haliotispira prima TaxID=3034016 RepID=A0ABY8MFA5_9SPIO|nr:hypothetical protein P0082_09225 [Candidatus Haliotispira prima]